MYLQDKVVLITGSTTGIGEATARLAVAQGAQVMIHGRNEAAAQALCQELGSTAAYVIADLGDPESCARIVQATVARFGRLDGVVNNAAVTTRSTLETTDAALFDQIVGINLRAPILIIREAVNVFRQQAAQGRPGGAIVNIGSINALSGAPNLLAYSAAKGGLMTATQNLANALATEKIRVEYMLRAIQQAADADRPAFYRVLNALSNPPQHVEPAAVLSVVSNNRQLATVS